MKEEKELKSFSNGEYIFQETRNDNQFYFFREDGNKLGDVGRMPMNMYQGYMRMKMFESESIEMVANNIRFETSDDGTCIRLTTFAIGEKDPLEQNEQEELKEEENQKQQEKNGIKRFIKSIFNKI